MHNDDINSFEDFWPYYVREHRLASNRYMHFIGSTLVLVLLGAAAWFGQWVVLFLLPIVGYGFAWTGHFFIERNRPATFRYPLWSLAADWKMWAYMLAGKMNAEVERILSTPART